MFYINHYTMMIIIPRFLVGKVEVSKIWIIVIFVSELSACLVLGLSNIDVKSEGAEAIARFAFIQIDLVWVKERNVNIPLFNM